MSIENLAKIGIDKSRVKEFTNSSNNRIVYLDNNTEFQIELFNPFTYEIAATISLDDKSEGLEMLIIKPGQRIWLDRYLDVSKKFKFSTYTVEDSNEAKQAIAKNGDITIKFYKEKINKQFNTYTLTKNLDDIWEPYYTDKLTWSSNINSISNCQNSISSLSLSCNDINTTNCYNTITTSNKTIETGRIEYGSTSDQQFVNVNKDFEYFPFKTEIIKILPTSQKPVYASDLQKRYCYNCGRKLKEKFKFCPFCGAKQ